MAPQGRVLLFLGVIAVVVASGLWLCFWRERPYVLIRFTGRRAIEATAEFQHKTKLRFEVAQAEALMSDLCDNFEFRPERMPLVREYLQSGTMIFIPYGNSRGRESRIPYEQVSLGTGDLESTFLSVRRDSCEPYRDVTHTFGAYEVKLGEAVTEVTNA